MQPEECAGALALCLTKDAGAGVCRTLRIGGRDDFCSTKFARRGFYRTFADDFSKPRFCPCLVPRTAGASLFARPIITGSVDFARCVKLLPRPRYLLYFLPSFSARPNVATRRA